MTNTQGTVSTLGASTKCGGCRGRSYASFVCRECRILGAITTGDSVSELGFAMSLSVSS